MTPGLEHDHPSFGRRHRVVIVGSSFAGLTAALESHRRLGDAAEITVIDPRDRFTFIPSLIWVPFGGRQADDIQFELAPMYGKKGIRFVNTAATRIDGTGRVVHTADGQEHPYDRLVIATGPRLAFERIPGLGPHGGHTQSVCTMEHAVAAKHAWERFLERPGPIVVGTAQGGSCFGASYEFLLNAQHALRKAGIADKVPVTFISSEPFLGHFGLGGVGDSEQRVQGMFDKLDIRGIANASIDAVEDGAMHLAGGETLEFAYSMIVPPFAGVDAVMESDGLANPAGFIPITDEYRHAAFPEIFAAGVDVAIAPKTATLVPTGVPKTGYMSEHMAKIAAENIAADLQGGEHHRVPLDDLGAVCILDGGDTGMIIKTDRVLGDAEHTHIMSGPQAHWAKIAFEKVFISARKHGRLVL